MMDIGGSAKDESCISLLDRKGKTLEKVFGSCLERRLLVSEPVPGQGGIFAAQRKGASLQMFQPEVG